MKIKIGSKIKNFEVESTIPNKKKFSDFLDKNLVLYFYPKDMTPGCTTESIEFNDNITKFRRATMDLLR